MLRDYGAVRPSSVERCVRPRGITPHAQCGAGQTITLGFRTRPMGIAQVMIRSVRRMAIFVSARSRSDILWFDQKSLNSSHAALTNAGSRDTRQPASRLSITHEMTCKQQQTENSEGILLQLRRFDIHTHDIHTHAYLHIHTPAYTCTYLCTCTCVYTHTHTHRYT